MSNAIFEMTEHRNLQLSRIQTLIYLSFIDVHLCFRLEIVLVHCKLWSVIAVNPNPSFSQKESSGVRKLGTEIIKKHGVCSCHFSFNHHLPHPQSESAFVSSLLLVVDSFCSPRRRPHQTTLGEGGFFSLFSLQPLLLFEALVSTPLQLAYSVSLSQKGTPLLCVCHPPKPTFLRPLISLSVYDTSHDASLLVEQLTPDQGFASSFTSVSLVLSSCLHLVCKCPFQFLVSLKCPRTQSLNRIVASPTNSTLFRI
jgi:hypothetical protein